MGDIFSLYRGGPRHDPHDLVKRLPSFRPRRATPATTNTSKRSGRAGHALLPLHQLRTEQAGPEPLPDGSVKAFRLVSADKLYAFVGSAQVKIHSDQRNGRNGIGARPGSAREARPHELGKSEVRFASGAMWLGDSTGKLGLRGPELRRTLISFATISGGNFSGRLSLATEAKYEKWTQQVKFILPLKPHAKQTFTYELTVHHGVNVTK